MSNYWSTYEASQRAKLSARQQAKVLRNVKRCVDCREPTTRHAQRCYGCSIERYQEHHRKTTRGYRQRKAGVEA